MCPMNTDAAVWRAVQTGAAFRRSIWEVDEERGGRWRMDCKVDRCQHAQRGQKAYHIEIGIVQDGDQPTDEIRRGWGLSG